MTRPVHNQLPLNTSIIRDHEERLRRLEAKRASTIGETFPEVIVAAGSGTEQPTNWPSVPFWVNSSGAVTVLLTATLTSFGSSGTAGPVIFGQIDGTTYLQVTAAVPAESTTNAANAIVYPSPTAGILGLAPGQHTFTPLIAADASIMCGFEASVVIIPF